MLDKMVVIEGISETGKKEIQLSNGEVGERTYSIDFEIGEKMKDKIMLFAQLVSEINISKYEQKEYVQIVKAIYFEIFGAKADEN